jgi:hypothetical protein
MEVSGQIHAWTTLPRGNRSWFPLDRRPGGLQSQSGHCGGKNNFLPLLGINSSLSAHSPTWYWLSYSGSIFHTNKLLLLLLTILPPPTHHHYHCCYSATTSTSKAKLMLLLTIFNTFTIADNKHTLIQIRVSLICTYTWADSASPTN